ASDDEPEVHAKAVVLLRRSFVRTDPRPGGWRDMRRLGKHLGLGQPAHEAKRSRAQGAQEYQGILPPKTAFFALDRRKSSGQRPSGFFSKSVAASARARSQSPRETSASSWPRPQPA